MATQKVNIQVSTTGAKKSKEQLSGLSGAISRVGKAAGIASAAYFGAKGLIGAFSSVIEASARQEQAEKALEVALGRTSTALLNQASALQSVTTAGDEAIIEQQAFLASLKFTEDQIKTILPVALDLSAATGISLESAVRNTAKTFSGLAGELGELVPQLRDLTTEEMKAGRAVEVLGELFEGQASEQTETLSGSLQQMTNAIGDAGEAFGSLLAPTVITTAKAVQSLAEGLGATISKFRRFKDQVEFEFIAIIDESAPSIDRFRDKISSLSKEEILELGKNLQEQSRGFELSTNQTNILTAKLEALAERFEILDSIQFDMNDKLELHKELRESEDSAIGNIDEKYQKFIETQRKKVKAQEEEQSFNARLIQQYPEIATKLGLVNQQQTKYNLINKESLNTVSKFAFALNSASQLNRDASHRNALIAKRAAQLEAVVNTASAVVEALPNIPLSIAMGALGAIQIAKIESAKFADGGIVPGYGNTDSVPAMLTPGEVILNASQQEGLVNQLNGINVNINGNVIGTTEFVRDTLVPEIQKAVRFA
tara:strand:+ start:2740 stop:4368 length:1629 start_codon:yes stop_codon:yes gene_type:complete